MGDQVKRRHHTVPRFILKNFADDNLMLDAWQRSGKKHTIHIDHATVIKNFYNATTAVGGPVDAVEDWLAEEVEGPVSPIIAAIVAEDSQPSPSAVSLCAGLAASGVLRTATVRSYLTQIGEALGPMMVIHEQIKRSGLKVEELAPEEMARFEDAATQAWQKHAPDDTHALLRIFLRKHAETKSLMDGWGWSVAVSNEPLLIISDAPVATVDLDPGWHGVLPPGSPVYMPLSPRHLLVGEPNPIGPVSTDLTPAMARLVNQRVTAEANNAIYTTPERPWPSYLHLGSTAPTLPPMNIRWSDSDPDAPATFPASYPEIKDPKVAALIQALGGTDDVE